MPHIRFLTAASPVCRLITQTALERRLHALGSGVTGGDGWYGACARGAGPRDATPAAAAANAANAAAAAALFARSGSLPAAMSLDATASAAAGLGGAAAAAAAAVAAVVAEAGALGGCSEYVARLAEGVAACTEHALLFLAATNPQVRTSTLASCLPCGFSHASC